MSDPTPWNGHVGIFSVLCSWFVHGGLPPLWKKSWREVEQPGERPRECASPPQKGGRFIFTVTSRSITDGSSSLCAAEFVAA